jgi:hypothetical protein
MLAMDDSDLPMRTGEGSIRAGVAGIAAILMDRMGSRAGVQAVFGEPVERDGVTVIPVGRVLWGCGGGEFRGGQAGEDGEGSGGGGGVLASPAGYIEISGGTAAYRRIGFPASPAMVVAGALAAYLAMRGLGALRR